MESKQYSRQFSVKVEEKLPSYHKPQTYQDKAIRVNVQAEQGEPRAIREDGWSQIQGNLGRKDVGVCKRYETAVLVHLPAVQWTQTLSQGYKNKM